MPDQKLKVISEPAENTRTVMTGVPPGTPFYKSSGDVNLLCGQCDTVLAENMNPGQVKNIVLQCPECKSYNDVP